MPPAVRQKRSFPNPMEAGCCLFLCESDGRVIQDFADSQTSGRALIPAPVLSGLIGHDRMLDFLALIEAGGAAPGSEISIGRESPVGSLVMRGTLTPYGTLVFAVLPATEEDTTEAIGRGAPLHRRKEDTSRTLSQAVHDLKNPISSIIGACEYLTQYCEEDSIAKHLEMISSMEASARMLLELSVRLSQVCGLSGRGRSGK